MRQTCPGGSQIMRGEYVLIKGDKVDGFYESRDEALTAGYSRFGIGPLFVKQVLPSEPVHYNRRCNRPAQAFRMVVR